MSSFKLLKKEVVLYFGILKGVYYRTMVHWVYHMTEGKKRDKGDKGL